MSPGCDTTAADVATAASLPWNPALPTCCTKAMPMLGSREMYLPLWSDDNMSLVPAWRALTVQLGMAVVPVSPDQPSIRAIVETQGARFVRDDVKGAGAAAADDGPSTFGRGGGEHVCGCSSDALQCASCARFSSVFLCECCV